ncbi:unnamed protein product, partial [Closterium sp. Naga37s-1]
MTGLHLMLQERPIAIIGPTTSSQVALLSGHSGTSDLFPSPLPCLPSSPPPHRPAPDAAGEASSHHRPHHEQPGLHLMLQEKPLAIIGPTTSSQVALLSLHLMLQEKPLAIIGPTTSSQVALLSGHSGTSYLFPSPIPCLPSSPPPHRPAPDAAGEASSHHRPHHEQPGLHLMLQEKPLAIIGPTTSSQVALLSGHSGTSDLFPSPLPCLPSSPPPHRPAPDAAGEASSHHRPHHEQPGLHLMLQEKPLAIIGPTTSSQVALLSGLAGTTRIPLLSYSATDLLLTTSRQWPYFMRTVPSDATKMEAIADLLALYGYKHFVAIFTDDRFGQNGISVLENILQNRWGWQHPVVARVALKRGREYDDARSSLEKLQQVRTSVMIIHAGGDGPDAVLKAAVELGMFSRGYVWITTEPTSLQSFTYDGATASFMPQVQGLISMASFVPPSPALTVFRAEWKEHMSGQKGPSSAKVIAETSHSKGILMWGLSRPRLLSQSFEQSGRSI